MVEAEVVEGTVEEEDEDVLEETPDFLQETPEHDRLWFEQKPPRDFDFDAVSPPNRAHIVQSGGVRSAAIRPLGPRKRATAMEGSVTGAARDAADCQAAGPPGWALGPAACHLLAMQPARPAVHDGL